MNVTDYVTGNASCKSFDNHLISGLSECVPFHANMDLSSTIIMSRGKVGDDLPIARCGIGCCQGGGVAAQAIGECSIVAVERHGVGIYV
jgi:hypothetical protein